MRLMDFMESMFKLNKMLNSYLFVIRNMPVFNECSFYKDLSLTGLLAYVFQCFSFLPQVARTFPVLSLLQLTLPKSRVLKIQSSLRVVCCICFYVNDM